MDFRALLQNRTVLIGLIAALVVIGALVIFVPMMSGGGGIQAKKEPVINKPLELFTTKNLGQALEVQALLAREGIKADRRNDGSKSTIYLESYTQSQRDRALLAIVKSGIMDEHTGLEVFDKGDFTSTKQDKKIRLARAINGELSRLIRKIPPIENASVFVSIPDSTIFTSMQKPVTATVQLTVPSGMKLGKEKIKAIKNLLLGSIQGLLVENISITDTNGNVYNSMISTEGKMLDMIEENDRYMKSKVQAQLDRLIGKGNYVVTVSTHLRQVPIEKSSIVYNPSSKTVLSEQKFVENLGDRTQDKNKLSQAVSSYIPANLPQNTSSSQNRNYTRSAQELQYGVTKTQIKEYQGTGIIEDISIAVTLENNAMPPSMTINEFKELVAKSASPKVSAQNVKVAFAETVKPFLASERPVQLPKPESSGNPWWIPVVFLGLALLGGLGFVLQRAKAEAGKHQHEIQDLKEFAQAQAQQIEQFNNATSQIMAQQQELKQTIVEEQQKVQQQVAAQPQPQQAPVAQVDTSFDDISLAAGQYDEEELGDYLKSWIEKED